MMKHILTLAGLPLALLLSACSTLPGPAPARKATVLPAPNASTPTATNVAYDCGHAPGFELTLGADSAVLTGPRGRLELLRDAGGLTPQQTVYTNARFRLALGLGPQGQQAVLQTLQPLSIVRCKRI